MMQATIKEHFENTYISHNYRDINVFFVESKINSEKLTTYVLNTFYNVDFSSNNIVRNKNGKPYLKRGGYCFSVSHCDNLTVIAVSRCRVGIDAELFPRNNYDYKKLSMKYFSQAEQDCVKSHADFTKLWTMKESAIKCIGGSIAHDLKTTTYENGKLEGKKYSNLTTETFMIGDVICSLTHLIGYNINQCLIKLSVPKEI